MLNNAIDHSESKLADIRVAIDKGVLEFQIRDFGVGAFQRVRKTFRLETDQEAVEHILKGKQTTAPEAHSGQGIFFTSKIADRFQLRSGRLVLKFDNDRDDIVLGETRQLIGTEVKFSIRVQTRKSLKKLFSDYANEDFEFEKTSYPIVLLAQNGAVSRSQARRLTIGLDEFDRIALDFSKVKELGQGFADEIFRVFQNKNPKKVIEVRNANVAVNFMIRRAARG